jgi:hypothetical protein
MPEVEFMRRLVSPVIAKVQFNFIFSAKTGHRLGSRRIKNVDETQIRSDTRGCKQEWIDFSK